MADFLDGRVEVFVNNLIAVSIRVAEFLVGDSEPLLNFFFRLSASRAKATFELLQRGRANEDRHGIGKSLGDRQRPLNVNL
jgi:hypothetical protein